MPHCVIEYAKPLKHIISVEALVEATHQALIDTGLFEPQAIKTRAHGVEHFGIGEDEANTFIHVHMDILPVRTVEPKA